MVEAAMGLRSSVRHKLQIVVQRCAADLVHSLRTAVLIEYVLLYGRIAVSRRNIDVQSHLRAVRNIGILCEIDRPLCILQNIAVSGGIPAFSGS